MGWKRQRNRYACHVFLFQIGMHDTFFGKGRRTSVCSLQSHSCRISCSQSSAVWGQTKSGLSHGASNCTRRCDFLCLFWCLLFIKQTKVCTPVDFDFAATPQLLENKRAVVAPVAWTSTRIPRVVRSTLGAEAAALCNSVDRLMWIRVLWAWMKNPSCNWRQPEQLLLEERTSALVTDCKGAYDLLTRTAIPQCSEHRTTIECLLVRERPLKTALLDGCHLRPCCRTVWQNRWIPRFSENVSELECTVSGMKNMCWRRD